MPFCPANVKAMNILIVGGAGMIGGYSALYMRSHGHNVTLAGRHPVENVPILEDLPFLKGDYIAGDYTLEILAEFDTILFAAGADPRHVPHGYPADEFYLLSCKAVIAFAQLARDAGVKRFVYIGSFYLHVAPDLVATTPYVRSRKLAADGVTSLAGPDFHVCSLDAPFVVGSVPGMNVPMFVAYTQYAEGKFEIPPFAPTGGTNFISVQSLTEAISAALDHNHSQAISGRAMLVGDENLTFSQYFGLFFHAVGNDIVVPALEREHPLLPDSALWTGRKVVAYEPDAQDAALLGYRRHDVQNAVENIVAEYRS